MVDVRIENVSKAYLKVQALEDINFTVNKGEIFGIIGPDGAGKSTLFRIISSLVLPDNGEVWIDSLNTRNDFKQIRQFIGYMPQNFSLYPDLSVDENLNFFASVFGVSVKENYYLIKHVFSQLERFGKFTAASLSGGMKQKLALSCALIHQPKLLLLDEPTFGVDPISRNDFWLNLKQLQSEFGITIIVSTAYMEEANLCDRIAFFNKGKMLDLDKPVNIIGKFPKKLFAINSDTIHNLVVDLRDNENTYSVYSFGDSVHYIDKRDDFDVEQLSKFLEEKEHAEIHIRIIEPTIEDCFIYLTHNK